MCLLKVGSVRCMPFAHKGVLVRHRHGYPANRVSIDPDKSGGNISNRLWIPCDAFTK